MKRRRRKSGQGLIEYAFLLVLMAGIMIAVLVLAGNQLSGTFNDISYEFNHLTDANTLAPDGTTTLGPGASPGTGSCLPGQSPVLRGHKWKCA
jgi:Flp pilus assembly pilin Flp